MNESPSLHTLEQRIDPITASVIQGALENIAIEMGYKLMRMSHSSIIRESEDFGAALIDLENRQLAEAKQSTPLQSGPIPGYIRGMRRQLAERGETIEPGDVFMHNDPYAGATHGPDVAFVVPAFHRGQLAGFAVTTAHHLDIGAHTPGSGGIVDAIDCYAEGLRFQAVKAYEGGKKNQQVWNMLRTNIRLPDIVLGDMDAQIAASRIGAQRYTDLIELHGLETIKAASEAMFNSSERMLRAAIAALPDGDYSASAMLDGFQDDPSPAREDLPIKVTLRVRGNELTVDLTGTAAQVADRPINMPLEGTVDCAIWLAVRSVLLDTATHGEIPQNSGLVRPIKIIAPKGTLANPIFPAPVIARFCTGIELSNAVVQAFALAVPRQICGGCGNGGGLILTGQQGNNFWVQVELFSGSYGGRFGSDGLELGRRALREYSQQSDRRHRIACAVAGRALRASRERCRTRQMARRGRFDPANRIFGGRRRVDRKRGSQIPAERFVRRRRRHTRAIDLDQGKRGGRSLALKASLSSVHDRRSHRRGACVRRRIREPA